MNEGWYVLEGDWGGEIYLTIPVAIAPSLKRLEAALQIIDPLEWPVSSGEDFGRGASAYLFTPSAEYLAEVGYDAGGGALTDKLWLNRHMLPGLRNWLPKFLVGQAGLPTPRAMVQWMSPRCRVRHFSRRRWAKIWRNIQDCHEVASALLEREEESRTKK